MTINYALAAAAPAKSLQQVKAATCKCQCATSPTARQVARGTLDLQHPRRRSRNLELRHHGTFRHTYNRLGVVFITEGATAIVLIKTKIIAFATPRS